MADAISTLRRPPTSMVVGGLLVLAGFLLTSVSWWFLLLVAAGAFGPGLLRELGLLHDKDEFQRRADHRAAYHAFLVVGIAAFALIAHIRAGGTFEHPLRLPTFLLALLWFTWFFSALLSFWGAAKTASRVLIAFGCAWLVFAILSNVGSEWTGWAALLLHPLLAVPFFALAWIARRWPRAAGGLLLVAAAGAFWLIGTPAVEKTSLVEALASEVIVLFVGPLVGSGIALLLASPVVDDDARSYRSPKNRAGEIEVG